MRGEPLWYEYLGLCAVLPVAFFGTLSVIYWLTDADPLIQEIWRLRGQNSVLRERLEQLEGERRRDSDTLRKVIDRK
jgi:hypothetical protein